MATDAEDTGFLSRWSRRKAQVRAGRPVPEPAPATPAVETADAPLVPVAHRPAAPAGEPATADAPTATHAAPPPAPTLDDVAALQPDGDFTRFVGRGVQPDVRNAALGKLFKDPHFNIMDGLDVYIDDYGKPDPLPPGMLRQLAQSAMLGLFDDEPAADAPPAVLPAPPAQAAAPADPPDPPGPCADEAAAPALPEPAPDLTLPTPADEDPALRLQPHDAAGPAVHCAGAGQDPRRQH